ncbi:aspartyl/glutamyl-tRNA amidotransferase subunit C [Patescibacteria group bacterium]|nr:aspartyl/glutamyl-tRNA amidotransferase subunit C [Patescibacteria group bacterium]
MATKEEVKKLAALARISVDEAELEAFTREFDAIVAYVGQLESLEIALDGRAEKPALYNVLRDDERPHEARAYTEKIAEQFPARKGDALSVKQIISHD